MTENIIVFFSPLILLIAGCALYRGLYPLLMLFVNWAEGDGYE